MRTLSLLPILLSCMAWGEATKCPKGQHSARTWPDGSNAEIAYCADDLPKPEPMDVPAIKESVKSTPHDKWSLYDCAQMEVDLKSWFSRNAHENTYSVYFTEPDKCTLEVSYWTCADKSRFLMTAEDGRRHCIRFAKD